MPEHVVCPCCRGAGKVELTGECARTLGLVRALGREVTAAELHRLHPIEYLTPPAWNSRLARLESLGLLVSRRDGRRRLYRLPEREEP